MVRNCPPILQQNRETVEARHMFLSAKRIRTKKHGQQKVFPVA